MRKAGATRMNTWTALRIVDGTQDASEEERLEAWQVLVDTNMVYTLPGSYGRMAQELIDQGLIHA